MRPIFLAFALSLAPVTPAFPQDADDAFGEKVRAFILANPEIILEAMDVLAGREADAERANLLKTSASAVLDVSHAVVLGNPDAAYRIIELFDYKCTSCKAGHPVLEAFVADNPDVAVMVQQLPILGPQSDRASRAYFAVFEIAGGEAAEALHTVLFDLKAPISGAILDGLLGDLGHDANAVNDVMYSEPITNRINALKDAALALGAIGTPVFVTERDVHQGVATPEILGEMLDRLKGS